MTDDPSALPAVPRGERETTARPLSRSLQRISTGLIALLLGIAAVSLTAASLQRDALSQFRQEVGRSVDAVSALSLDLADSQNALMLAASTYDPSWPGVAEESMAELVASMDDLDAVAGVIGNAAATEQARSALRSWLSAADQVLNGGLTAKSVATAEYPTARASLIAISEELVAAREERRRQHDHVIIWGAIAVTAATITALALVLAMSRYYVRRLATPLDQLKDMVDARVAGNLAVRARTDQGFSEAVRLARAINELSDANDSLRAAQEATIHSHLVAERVASHLAAADDPSMWSKALNALREDLNLDAVALLDGDAAPVAAVPAGDTTWLDGAPEGLAPPIAGQVDDTVIAPLLLGGQPLGTLVLHSETRRWSRFDAETLDLCGNHLAASLALQSVIETTRQLDEDKTRFLATTSHELRTPLTAVVAWLSMFEEGDLGALTDEQLVAMGVVTRNVARLRDLIEDLLTLNQLDSGHARAVRTPMDITAITLRVMESLAPMATRAGVSLVHDSRPCDGRGEALGDPVQVERAITNIVSNALKFTEHGGEAVLTARCSDDAITLTCTDTGIGIPADELPHVLDRFHRATNASGLPGTGLGLSIVHSIVEAHGGTFRLDSTEGVGTSVAITFPRQVSAHHPGA